jgi:predicted esterase
MRYRTIWSVLLIIALLFLPACAQVGDSTSNDLLSDFYGAPTQEALESAIDDLVDADVDAGDLALLLREGIEYSSDVPVGWSVYEFEGADGRTRPYHVYVPTDYDPNESYTLLLDLHGAVSSPAQSAEYLMERRRLWESKAEEYGWILLVPHGDRNATWFSEDGRANILGELAFVKHLYNVDENKVFVSGFSDGGSGAYWQAFHDPTPWAAMIAFHGHPGVGGYGPYQTYPRNLLNRPIRATTGEQDELYPPSNIAPFVGLFTELGVDLEWIVYPGGHEARFLSTEAEFTIDFVMNTERNPLTSEVVWETSNKAVARCDWVRIDDIADVGNNAVFQDINLAEVTSQIVFGASLAYQGGTLFTVAGLEPGSTAHVMGILNGDQILRIGRFEVLTQADLTVALMGKVPGDSVEVEIIRDGETMILTGIIPADELVFRRDVPTASIRVLADGNQIDVEVSHVGRYTLFISSEQFNLSQPIAVTTNGLTSFSEVVTPDVRFMLKQAAEDFDREMIYETFIEIEVPAIP